MDFALLRWRKMRFTHIGRSTGSSWAVATSIQTRKNVRVVCVLVRWIRQKWVRCHGSSTWRLYCSGYSMYIVYRIYIYNYIYIYIIYNWIYNNNIIHNIYICDILWLHDVTCARDGNPYSESLGYLLILKHCRWPCEIPPLKRAVPRLSESGVGIWACLKIGYFEFPQLLSHIITIPTVIMSWVYHGIPHF